MYCHTVALNFPGLNCTLESPEPGLNRVIVHSSSALMAADSIKPFRLVE